MRLISRPVVESTRRIEPPAANATTLPSGDRAAPWREASERNRVVPSRAMAPSGSGSPYVSTRRAGGAAPITAKASSAKKADDQRMVTSVAVRERTSAARQPQPHQMAATLRLVEVVEGRAVVQQSAVV